MLITCFQCRQQLDVPDDSAGKRIRCPHCSYVIVVPTKPKAAADGSTQVEPVVGLPSMDLDDGAAAPAPKPPATKIPATPLPPLPLPTPPVAMPKPKKQEPEEELPAPPSIERGARRRAPAGPAPAQKSGTVKALVILGFIGALGVGVVIGAVAVSENRRPAPQPQFAIKQPNFMPQIAIPPNMPPFGGVQNPNGVPQMPQPVWHEFQDYERRFKVAFAGAPAFKQMIIGHPMTGHEARDADWEFMVLHRRMMAEEYKAIPPLAHFNAVERGLSNELNLLRDAERACFLSGIHQGREWEFTTRDGRKMFARSFLVPDGGRFHHYVLTATAPHPHAPNPIDNLRRVHANYFFNSFVPIVGFEGANAGIGAIIFEEIDDTDNGGRRDNEILALAVHPTMPIAVGATAAAQIHVADINMPRQFAPGDGRSIEQAVISADGSNLLVSTGRMLHWWKDWDIGNGIKQKQIPARRCAVTLNNKLLACSDHSVMAFDLASTKGIATFDIKDMTLLGLAVANDNRTLAVHDEKSIAIWDWTEKKQHGHFDAHDALITALAFSPDGKTLASASADRTIKLWDVETRTERATLRQHAWTVGAIAFAPNGRHLISGGLDGMFLIWNLEQEKPGLVWAQAHQFPVRGVAFDAEGKHCYLTCRHPVTSNNKEARQYRRQIRKIAWNEIKANPKQAAKIVAQCAGLHLPTSYGETMVSRYNEIIVTTADVNPWVNLNFNQRIDAQGMSQTIRIWDGQMARQKHTITANPGPTGNPGTVLSPDGKWLVYAPSGQNTSVHVLEIATKSVSKVLFQDNTNQFPFVFFTPDSRFLWLAAKHEMLCFELPKPQPQFKKGMPKMMELPVAKVKQIPIRDADAPGYIHVIPSLDRKQFLVDLRGFDIGIRKRRLFDATTGQELELPKPAQGERSNFLRISTPMDRHRVIVQDEGMIELDDTLQGRFQAIGRIGPMLQGACIHPGGKMAAVGVSDHSRVAKIHLWDVESQKPILSVPDVLARMPSAVQFSQDGSRLSWVTNSGWTRILPTDWMLQRKDLLACDANEVAAP